MYKIIDSKKRYATIAADLLGSRALRARAAVAPAGGDPAGAGAGDPGHPHRVHRGRGHDHPDPAAAAAAVPAGADHVPDRGAGEGGARGEPRSRRGPSYDPFWFYPTAWAAYPAFMRELRRLPFDLVIEARADIRELFLLVRPLRARYKVSYDVGGGGYLLSHVVPYPGLKHKVEYHLDIARLSRLRRRPRHLGHSPEPGGAGRRRRAARARRRVGAFHRHPPRVEDAAQDLVPRAVRRAVRRTGGAARAADRAARRPGASVRSSSGSPGPRRKRP